MMCRVKLLLVSSVAAVLFSTLSGCTVTALAVTNKNPVGNFLDNVLRNKRGKTVQPPTDAQRGEALLKELNLQSNTEPKPFSAELSQLPALITASMPAIFRLGTGIFCIGYKASIVPKRADTYTLATLFDKYQLSEASTVTPQLQQREPLILYEFESCPYCRKVREAISILSLNVVFRPCPKNGYTWRRQLQQQYGQQATVPFLVDPNTKVSFSESDDILNYLFSTYGNGEIPWTLTPGNSAVVISEGLGLLFRGTAGGMARPSNPPTQPLTLWSYEGSPFCKLVKEMLCELEIEHVQVSCPRGSANRQAMYERHGRFQVPFLQDSNTGVSLFESNAIVEYLEKQYSVARSPVKYL